MTDHESLVRRSLAGTGAFDERVRDQADRLTDALADGAFDNAAATLGLELEVYALAGDGADCSLAPIPDDVYEGPADKELGLHNAELNAAPSEFDDDGVAAQAAEIERDLAATRERAREHGLAIVLDAMPAVAPAEGTHAYLDDVEVRGPGGRDTEGDRPVVVPGGDPDDPVLVARNMRRDPRYGALDNVAVRRAGGEIDFAVPGVETGYRTILFESLATSIQPHVQVPDPSEFPRYHNLATRTLGPLVALSANSPFLPGDCYGDVADPERLVEETHHELRIAAFEQSMNQSCRKVRVPDDLDEPADALGHVVADDSFAPFLREWIEREAVEEEGQKGGDPTSAAWEFDYKRGTFWRWVRGVAGGDAVDGACDERSLRIEYRPLPTQPTVRDIVGLQVLTAGLLKGLVAADHPLGALAWDDAERSFYAAVEDGLDAELAWVTADGERTDDSEEIFAEVFEYARRGLAEQGVGEGTRDRYLDPIEARWDAGVTPSAWKKARVGEHLGDGADLETALARMQGEYVELSRERESFAAWI
ncbi:hypothetical protein I7X12_09685 [Halosimplex litoreum]|uniref:Glutamate--cysteine ligase n=1 Tax=Halosimplex litoreum TaxID=1198301 RepID=A0A7U3WB53_9EURY|nr:hypothetical protein [Halosimplex litoreum]QPV64848.1 hypothetical protein I7X12_09685 [Halosimplex litoreum]